MKKGMFKVLTKDVMKKSEEYVDILAFMKFLPLHIDQNIMEDSLTYIGLSPIFKDVALGEMVPEYLLVVTVDPETQGIIEVTAEEVVRTNNQASKLIIGQIKDLNNMAELEPDIFRKALIQAQIDGLRMALELI